MRSISLSWSSKKGGAQLCRKTTMDTAALPSTITLLKEKTVSYLKCHSRGCEKVLWPIACVAILVVTILLLGVAGGTQTWLQMEVRNNASEERGNITFGLLRGSHIIRYGESPFINTISDSYFLFDKFSLIYLIKFYVTFGLSMVAILLSILNVAVTLLNSYKSVTSCWRGPSMMYLLGLLTSLCGLVAVGSFLDHYLWDLDTVAIFINSTQLSPDNALTISNVTFTSFEYLLTDDGYHLVPSFGFSFYLEIPGACLPLLVTLLAWRLAVLLPASSKHHQKKRNSTNYPLKTSNSLQYYPPVSAVNPIMTTSLQPDAPQEDEDSFVTSSPEHSPQVTRRRPSGGLVISPHTQKEVLY